ncbi:male sterility protein-domain-containing protein [Mycena olivaceomarginata]|nr:male sterility protein-domain-containing protein [Mycena olivaceomarginata]
MTQTSHNGLKLTRPELEEFILNAIIKTVGLPKSTKIDREEDLFAVGVDSMKAMRIRNVCQNELFLAGKTLDQNAVLDYPSKNHILDLQAGASVVVEVNQHEAQMTAVVDNWMAKVGGRQQTTSGPKRPEDARVIVLTGATGSLGAHILYQLVSSSNVRKVICLSRAKSHEESVQRVAESMKARKLPPPDNKLLSYAANVNAPLLGLTETEYNLIRDENAWPVNFMLSLDSYDEHVGGAVNLINLCLASPHAEPAAFFFSSSISARNGAPDLSCNEDFPPSTSTAAATGYGRSKWVVEKICERAAENWSVPVAVLRIGQIVGDSLTGNMERDRGAPIPLHPSWLPVDYAGQAIAEVVLFPLKSAAVYNIDILAALRVAGLKFEAVDRAQWLQHLAESEPDGEKNPTIKLLPFFQMRYGTAYRRPMVFLTDKTAAISPSIRNAPPISPELVGKWVANWRETGFLSPLGPEDIMAWVLDRSWDKST